MPAMPFTPPADDVSVGMLKSIFGPVVDVLISGADPNTVSAASSVIATLFGYFNSGILVVAAVIAGYVMSMGAINTATDGEAFGKAWSAVWTPVRFVGGGAVLLPSASGYSFIQMIVLMLSIWGAGFASNLYSLAMSMGVISPAGIVKSSGNKSWDNAALNAIDKTEKLPSDNGKIWSPLTIVMSPQTLLAP